MPFGVCVSRDIIIAIVAEYYLNDNLQQAKIEPISPDTPVLERVQHGAWRFWYDEKENVIYL